MDDKAAKNQRKNKIGGWILAAWGAAILVRAIVNGNLFGAPGPYGTGVGIANLIAVMMVVAGLYFALRKTVKPT